MKKRIFVIFPTLLLMVACSQEQSSSYIKTIPSQNIIESSAEEYVSESDINSYISNITQQYYSLIENYDYIEENKIVLDDIYNSAIKKFITSITTTQALEYFDTAITDLSSVEYIVVDEVELANKKTETKESITQKYLDLSVLGYSEENQGLLLSTYEEWSNKVDLIIKMSDFSIVLDEAYNALESIPTLALEAEALVNHKSLKIQELNDYATNLITNNYYSTENVNAITSIVQENIILINDSISTERIDVIIEDAKIILDNVEKISSEDYLSQLELTNAITNATTELLDYSEELLSNNIYGDNGILVNNVLTIYIDMISSATDVNVVSAILLEAKAELDSINKIVISVTDYAVSIKEKLIADYTYYTTTRVYYDLDIIQLYYDKYIKLFENEFSSIDEVDAIYEEAKEKLAGVKYMTAMVEFSATEVNKTIDYVYEDKFFTFNATSSKPITVIEINGKNYINIPAKVDTYGAISFEVDNVSTITITCINSIKNETRLINLYSQDGSVINSSTVKYYEDTIVEFRNLASGIYYIGCSNNIQILDIKVESTNKTMLFNYNTMLFEKLLALKDIYTTKENELDILDCYDKYYELALTVKVQEEAVSCFEEAKNEMKLVYEASIGEDNANS